MNIYEIYDDFFGLILNLGKKIKKQDKPANESLKAKNGACHQDAATIHKLTPVLQNDHNLQRYITTAKANVATISLGIFSKFFPIIYIPASGLLLYTYKDYFKETSEILTFKRKMNYNFLFLLGIVTGVATGNLVVVSFGAFIYSISNIMLSKTKLHSQTMLADMFTLKSRLVTVIRNNKELRIPIEMLKPDDVIEVVSGDIIPVDGVVISGSALIDQHTLTGESLPIEIEVGDRIFASTINSSGNFQARVEKSGFDTVYGQICEMVIKVADFRSEVQLKGEVWANDSVKYMLGFAGAAVAFTGNYMSAVIILNSSYGARIRLLAPLAALDFMRESSEIGMFIKDGRALEAMQDVDVILFDKTGTLTIDEPHVDKIIGIDGYTEDDILEYAAAAERKFEHPISKAIISEALARHINIPFPESKEFIIGFGITTVINGRDVKVGSNRFMSKGKVDIPNIWQDYFTQFKGEKGRSFVFIAIDNKLAGIIELKTAPRHGVHEVIQELKKRNIGTIGIVSGDNHDQVKSLANEIGIDTYFYEVMPEQKNSIVNSFKEKGKKVCFIGDGVNDSLAMLSADVSISLSNATTVAQNVAQVILIHDDLNAICKLIDMSRKLDKVLKSTLSLTMAPTVMNLVGSFASDMFSLTAAVLNKNLFTIIGYANIKISLKQKFGSSSE